MRLPHPGETFNDWYEIVQVLGQGGYARVFRARDVRVERDVALKVLLPEDGRYGERVERRFMREARVIAGMHGPHTIDMFDFGRTDDGMLFMAFEFVKGRDLGLLLKQRGKLAPDVVRHILGQILSGLEEAHSAGVLHRDIKPANILVFEHLDDPHCVKLIDFGIAKLFDERIHVDVTSLTVEGMVVGTPRYLAPEQLFGEELTPATDIYSAGLVAFEMLFGHPAVDGASRQQLLRAKLSKEPIEVPDVEGADRLCVAIREMIRPAARDRPQDIGGVRSALMPLPHPNSYRDRLPDAHVDLPEQPRVHPTLPIPLAIGLAVGLVVAIIVLVGSGVFGRDEHVAPPRPAPLPGGILRATTADAATSEPVEAADRVAGDDANEVCTPERVGRFEARMVDGLDVVKYWAYVPTKRERARLPVVLIAHKMFGSGREFISETRFDAVAQRFGLVVISIKFGDLPYSAIGLDAEKQFRRALDDLAPRACVDRSRIYAIGHAGGGRVVRNLRCEMELSAVATTADGQHPDETNCDPERDVPILRIFGENDPHLGRHGEPSCRGLMHLTVEETTARWRKHNGCSEDAEPQRWSVAEECTLWPCPAAVVSCEVPGGFNWPHVTEMLQLPGCPTRPMKFDVGPTMARFFEEFGVAIE